MQPDLFDLTGSRAAVTGAASGLGRAIALGLARYGADVALADVNEDGLQQTCREVLQAGRRGLAVRCDVTDPESITHWFTAIEEALGGVDILVNSAGVLPSRCHPEELALSNWERILKINATGTWLCAQAAGQRMIRQGTGGSIINISSIASQSALGRGNLPYSASKAAINQMTRELAVEWARHRIRVNALLPCQFRTPAVQPLLQDDRFEAQALRERLLNGIPMGRMGEPEELVGPVVFLASDAAAFVTGVLLPVDGGNLALNPGGSPLW